MNDFNTTWNLLNRSYTQRNPHLVITCAQGQDKQNKTFLAFLAFKFFHLSSLVFPLYRPQDLEKIK